MYEVGRIYIWVKCEAYPHIIGTETTVLSGPEEFFNVMTRKHLVGWLTDTTVDGINGCALQGSLRPKDAPSGEKIIREMFDKTTEMEGA